MKEGLVKPPVGLKDMTITPSAKLSVWIFLIGVLCVVFYASAISPAVGLIKPVIVPRDAAIMSLMLAVGALITVLCKVNLGDVAGTSVFKSGMVACICVLGVAWLGDTFVSGHTKEIKDFAAQTISQYPALLAVVFFLAAMLLYSQAATAKAITPTVVAALGITAANPDNSYMLVACFAAVSALFVLPTYPTLLGAVQMDDTGTTRIGKWVFNHSFFIPGVLAIFFLSCPRIRSVWIRITEKERGNTVSFQRSKVRDERSFPMVVQSRDSPLLSHNAGTDYRILLCQHLPQLFLITNNKFSKSSCCPLINLKNSLRFGKG